MPLDWHRFKSNIGWVEEAPFQIKRVPHLILPRMCIPTTCGNTIDELR
jgi:hypothetical protein